MRTPTGQHALYRPYAVTHGEMSAGGAGVDEVKGMIDAPPVSGEEQSASWLWAITGPDRRLREERDRVSAVRAQDELAALRPGIERSCVLCGGPIRGAQGLQHVRGTAVHVHCERARSVDRGPL